jgi:hypothetical protein
MLGKMTLMARRYRMGPRAPADGVVWISEDIDYAEDGSYLTGRFYGHLDRGRVSDEFEDLSLEEAVAWGRARAQRVLIRIGYGRHVPVDDADLTPPVRRRTPDEEWKDRTEADPPIAWAAEVLLSPPDPEARQDGVVAAVAEAAGARWDSEPLDGWVRDLRAARRRLREGKGGSWITEWSPSYRLRLTVEASTHDQAVATARSRCPAPAGWREYVTAEPARPR